MLKDRDLWDAHFPQFVRCGDRSVESLMNSAIQIKLPAGHQVFYPGKTCENYLLMLEGSVKTQLLSENGREVLLYYVRPGESCVLTTSCLLGGNRYPAEGITESDVHAFAIPAHAFYRGIDQSPFFREFVFKNFSSRLSNVISRMESVVFGAIDERLSKALLDTGSSLIGKTHQELAAELGSAREVVSRHLKRFESFGWLRLNRGTIEIIDVDALRKVRDNS
ncbi:MAG: Crp/Fnr family transcriptional regulator [Gammaproteobacteria bacterium]